jgi:shikimate kinase
MKNIVLCGFMGCGKTTAGKIISSRLGLEFVDMDSFIESREGAAVSEIFSKKGEKYFRAAESAAARELSAKSGAVISAGGGALLNPANASELRRGGVIVYLDVPVGEIALRLKNDRSRPLLAGPGGAQAMRRLYVERAPLYRAAADITVSIPRGSAPENSASLVLAALRRAEVIPKTEN